LNLSEKNNLYLQQKSEIERLKKLVVKLEKKLNIRNEHDKNELNIQHKQDKRFEDNKSVAFRFLYRVKSKFDVIEAKDLYEMYVSEVDIPLGKKFFYKSVRSYGWFVKRGNFNKMYVSKE